MGNGVSGDQGNLPSYGKRDVGATFDRKQHDWSEQARAQEVNTLVSNVNSYIGAQSRGVKLEDKTRSGAYNDVFNTEPTPSTEEDNTRYAAYGAYSGAQLRNRKSSVMKDDACSNIPNRNQKSWVMKDNTQSSVILRNRKKKEDRSLKTEESKTKGNMQVETDTGQTAYTLPSMTIPRLEEDRRILLLSRLPSDETEEETSIESSLSMLQLEDTVDKLLSKPQVNNFRSKPETEIESSEKSDPASYEQQCYREEPLAKPDMEIQWEIYPINEENLVYEDTRDDDVPTRRCRAGKAEVDAKAGATRHLPSDPDRVTERAINVPDAKADKHRHSTPDDDELNYVMTSTGC